MFPGRLLSGLFALVLCAAGLQAASPTDLPGVHNFHKVNEHVYRGAQPSREGFASLANLGIKTVIDLRGERSEADAVQRAGLRYVRMPWNGHRAPSDSQMATVLTLLNDNAQWPVFVHCRRGADRTGTAIACYRILHDHWSNQQALAEAKAFGMSSLEIAMRHYIQSFAPAQIARAAHAAPLTPAVLLAAPAVP